MPKISKESFAQQGLGGYSHDFFVIGATIRIGWELLRLPYAGFLTNTSILKIFLTQEVYLQRDIEKHFE